MTREKQSPKKKTNDASHAKHTNPSGSARRADGAGHLDPEHAARLLRLARETERLDRDLGFVSEDGRQDSLAQHLGADAVAAMTSGEDAVTEDLDAAQEEETGGPFVETDAAEEFAAGTDASNIPEAMREPFPRTSGGKS